MKPLHYIAHLALLCAILNFLAFPDSCHAQQFPSAAHLQAVKARIPAASVVGGLLANAPAEYSQMMAKRATFLQNPVRQGTHSLRDADNQPLQVWIGYTGTKIDSTPPPGVGEQYPLYEGEGAKAAIIYTHLTGDTVGVGAVRRNLWVQATLPNLPNHTGHHPRHLPTPPLTNNGSRKPNSFSFSPEAAWVKQYAQTLALARPYMAAPVFDTCSRYARVWARYLSRVMVARFTISPQGGDLPGYRSRNLATRRGIYADNFTGGNGAPAYYLPNGTAGPILRGSGYVFTNVYHNYLGAMAAVVMLTGDTALYRDCRAFAHAALFFSQFPDGVTHEAERNGDYGVGREVWYVAKCLENYLEAELMLRQRGLTMLDITTSGGTPNTVSQQAKTYRAAVNRLLTYYSASDLRYWTKEPTTATRIVSPYVGPPASRFGDDYEVSASSIFSMAAAVYGDTASYLRASRYRLPGMASLPSKGLSPARGVQRFTQGRDNQFQPGILTLWAGLDTRSFYPAMKVTLNAPTTVTAGTASVNLSANLAGATRYTWRYIGPGGAHVYPLQGARVRLLSDKLGPLPAGQHIVEVRALLPNGTTERTTATIIVQ